MKDILFVDDDPKCLASLKRILRKYAADWRFHIAQSVDEGIRRIEERQIDLVICDILMPEKTGFEMLKTLKADEKTKSIPVVMLTGMVDSKLKLKALSMGAADLLNKPIEKAELVTRISNCLKIKEYHDQILNQNLFLEKRIQERTRHAMMAAEIGSILVQGTDINEMAGKCCGTIVHYLDAAFARIWILDDQNKQLELMASNGMFTSLGGNHGLFCPGKLKIENIAKEKRAMFSNTIAEDADIDDQTWLKKEKITAFAAHPLIVGSRTVGVVAMFSRQLFETADLDAIASVADEIALGIDRKKAEEKAWFFAYHDTLTRLPNRQFFLKTLEHEVEYAGRYKKKFAVVLIDLDNFNRVNESLGHNAGDQCLQAISKRLKNCLRSSDMLARLTLKETPMVRMGGDEFIILLQNTNDIFEIGQACQRLLNEFNRLVHVVQKEIFISASIGVAVFPEDGTEPGELLKNTETALYDAKKKGKRVFSFYSESMNQESIKLFEMENDLRKAVINQQFSLYFQPKIRLLDKKIVGAEALIRWEIEQGKFIPPSAFIPVAEKNGMIVSIGEWVLETACKTCWTLHQAGHTDVHIAVNVSALQLDQNDLTDNVASILERNKISPENIEIEITETLVMSNPEKAAENLRRLKQMGFTIALDDFGTGYSSLAYLQKLPIDYVKIDLSFIRQILVSTNDAVMVKTIIDMAHNLGLRVIAEGVEEEAQTRLLEKWGCDIVQGFLFGRPMPKQQFIGLFNDNPSQRIPLGHSNH
ncbi:MAG: EAL domain-containing protein [Desulfobacter postgatei]|uniref:EAL domain-containing protein n=1 Tax=Desulfobacter postgatei TaxID=2293 RepID=UPI0023F0DBCD|nr:EAL domain-containing protein [Desulfobacter postgatei]MDD4274159.1 EAL domain-containing protein [Desulfobacter postgatei]